MDLQWSPSLSKFARVGPGGCTEIGDGSSCRLPLYFACSLMISIDGQLTSSLLVTDHIENTGSRGPPCYCWQHKLLHPVTLIYRPLLAQSRALGAQERTGHRGPAHQPHGAHQP
ncbi:hypothetical protein PVAP13_4KG184121 [Panicum virgatum]|uniref:Uncharacterized protein n=1 Tax=Panicum virgatum TaxID=38727 RepID=A0A8T0TFX1_PANVG|nr:hypothetical protein PVAP13_4KG184121 [Panicum virgatum]KAG2610690.1 hypothetical protein PVAP13_4KG184121 [Panicum virgatum]KAG2610691.1 hypothetical protein PVAP13_4KG184121 [Panicum virgatum]